MAAITITQDLKLSGSNLVSVHNFNKLIWTFVPTDDTKAITSTVVIGAYTFNGIQTARNTATTPDTFTFELDVTEILKYFHNDFLFKTVANDINVSTLVKSQLITIHGLEDAVSTDNEALTIYLSHGVNQIGYSGGSNVKYLYDRDDLTFHYFKDNEWEVYFFVPAGVTDLMTVDGVFNRLETISAESLNSLKFSSVPTALNTLGNHEIQFSPSTQLITGWTNVSLDTFTSAGRTVTSAISDDVNVGIADSNGVALVAGDIVYIIGQISIIAGLEPTLIYRTAAGTLFPITPAGDLSVNATITIVTPGTYYLELSNKLLVGFKSINCVFTLSYAVKLAPSQILNVRTLSITACGGVYVKYLSREGFYRYWLFNKFYSTEQNGSKIGKLVNYIDTMVGATAKTLQIGYKDTYEKILVSSENVAKSDREILIDIYTSPSVYAYINSVWVQVEVQATHTIREKYNFENISATLVLPERYTQRL